MKDSVKRIMTAVCAAAMAFMLTAGAAMASSTARPQPDGDGATTTMTTSAGETGETSAAADSNQVSSVVDSANNVTQVNTNREERSYQTRLGGFLWFLLSVVVNFVVSCWVGNRFYRLARKSNQSSAEVRALRKDIEEKFGSTLRDISEPAIEVMNQNENYSRTDEGLSMPDRQSKIELSDEEREMFRKWDAQRSSARTGRSVRQTREQVEDIESDYDDAEPDEDEMRQPAEPARRRSAYQPTRSSSGIRFEDDEDDDDIYDEYGEDEYDDRRSMQGRRPAEMRERRERKPQSKMNKAKGKAKDFLSNMFPFDD